jgi:hypothetical protein
MAASAAQIARVRRMANEPTTTTYSDDDLAEAIERYPLVDALGRPPYRTSQTTPPELEANPYWTATYDLSAAASDIWEEKAAVASQDFDFQSAHDRFEQSQVYEQAMKQARHFRARRSWKTVSQRPEPIPTRDPSVGNAAE